MAAGLDINWVVTGETTSACIPPGETINFKWEGPYHNVVELGDNEGAYIDCILSEDQTEAVEGPWSTTLTRDLDQELEAQDLVPLHFLLLVAMEQAQTASVVWPRGTPRLSEARRPKSA